ncbi:MAG: hypothetical protein R6V75_09725 [Bacteroidales bacterium]
MNSRFFKPIAALVLLAATIAGVKAQTATKEIRKEFNTTSASVLVIDNQFGKLTVEPWDQNKVVIEVKIETKASDKAKADKLLERIQVDISESGSKILAKTRIEDKTVTRDGDKNESRSFSIDYLVKAPKSIKAELSNQFGDVSLGTLTGPVDLSVQFGSLNAVGLLGAETNIELQFVGKATIGELANASLEVQYSSPLKITKAGKLSIEAQFSTLEIGSVEVLEIETANSKVVIEMLMQSLSFEGSMGSLDVKSVDAGFRSIEAEQNMGEITLRIDPKAGYTLNAVSAMGSINVPDGFKADPGAKSKDREIPGVSAKKVTGTYGSGSSKINLEVNMGSIRIQ